MESWVEAASFVDDDDLAFSCAAAVPRLISKTLIKNKTLMATPTPLDI
jgi:hypothetical protein